MCLRGLAFLLCGVFASAFNWQRSGLFNWPASGRHMLQEPLSAQRDLISKEDGLMDTDRFLENNGEEFLEGDIIVDMDPTFMAIQETLKAVFWPKGVVYYELDSSLEPDRSTIEAALENEYHTKTCIRFVRRNGDETIQNYLYMRGDAKGCSSRLGMQLDGPQVLNLNNKGCINTRNIVHECMHALGFRHEQSRPDRDEYVTIMWDNILERHARNFNKIGWEQSLDAGTTYDFDSIMHYPLHAFAKNRKKPTIVPKVPIDFSAIPGRVLSPKDVHQINTVYNGCRNE